MSSAGRQWVAGGQTQPISFCTCQLHSTCMSSGSSSGASEPELDLQRAGESGEPHAGVAGGALCWQRTPLPPRCMPHSAPAPPCASFCDVLLHQ